MAHAIHGTNNPNCDYSIYSDPSRLQEDLNQDPKGTVERVNRSIEGILKKTVVPHHFGVKFCNSLKEVKFFSMGGIESNLERGAKFTQMIFLARYGNKKDLTEALTKALGDSVQWAEKMAGSSKEDLTSLFSEICLNGFWKASQKLLNSVSEEARKACIDAKDDQNRTLLMRIFSKLLELKGKSHNGRLTDLEFLEKEKPVFNLKRIALDLIDRKADLFSLDDQDYRALEHAIFLDEPHFIEKIIGNIPEGKRKDFIDKDDPYGWKAIYLACMNKRYEIAFTLMNFSPTLFFMVEGGDTVLHELEGAPWLLRQKMYRQFIQEMIHSKSIPKKMKLKPLLKCIREKDFKLSQEELQGLALLAKDSTNARALMDALKTILKSL